MTLAILSVAHWVPIDMSAMGRIQIPPKVFLGLHQTSLLTESSANPYQEYSAEPQTLARSLLHLYVQYWGHILLRRNSISACNCRLIIIQ
ncbi:Uncharacterised protein [Yersinia enterocolitica]|nr:Uncharacterised protein [Yersinia enterocolitica]